MRRFIEEDRPLTRGSAMATEVLPLVMVANLLPPAVGLAREAITLVLASDNTDATSLIVRA